MCIVCGDAVLRSAACRCDREGNRWEQHGKRPEYLCKSCCRGPCHQFHEEFEGLLGDIEERDISDEEFLLRYSDTVKERYESPGERGR